MPTDTLIAKPVFHSSIEIDVDTHVFNEQCTIVHLQYYGYGPIRIWASTYLVQDNGIRKKLVKAFNISLYPEWKEVHFGHRFTLLFEGLDKDCQTFDLYEDIPEPGGFYVQGVERNATDVYWLSLNEEN